jgi:hypothetical protein
MGLAIGVLFHAFLGLGFYAFSTGLFALYLMFVPATVFDAADDWLAAHRARGGLRALLLQPTVWRVATVAFSVALAVVWVQARSLGPTLVLFWFAGVLLFLALPYATRTARASFADPLAGRLFPTGAALLIPALLFANGLSPYLGLRTTPTFSMFSNLRTIGGSNHLIVPSGALRIAGYQDDLIVILDTDDEELDRFAKRGRRRVFYSFKGRIQSMAARGKTDIAVTWRRGDQTVSVASAERHPELAAPIPWYERKFLRFRPGPIGARRSCSW